MLVMIFFYTLFVLMMMLPANSLRSTEVDWNSSFSLFVCCHIGGLGEYS